jgi:hypothetical protein
MIRRAVDHLGADIDRTAKSLVVPAAGQRRLITGWVPAAAGLTATAGTEAS